MTSLDEANVKGFKCVKIVTNDAKEHLLRAEVCVSFNVKKSAFKYNGLSTTADTVLISFVSPWIIKNYPLFHS